MPKWEVVGGEDKGGILVRVGQELTSPYAAAGRLSTGAMVEQVELVGDRLHYRVVEGEGPEEGWVSLKVNGKSLVILKEDVRLDNHYLKDGTRLICGPGSGIRHRWAVNIDEWHPDGGADGSEFQFLLNLIQEKDDRDAVMKFKFWEDRKRALASRLLVRQASASALKLTHFRGITIKRTKGRKPFLAAPLPCEKEAPNWNVNVSHEGSWVVCASEPITVVGIDVAELRRMKKNGDPIDFHRHFSSNLTEHEWNHVNSVGPDLDDQYEVFSRFWSAKEAFVKARGDGIAFELGKAEFHWDPLPGFPAGTAYEGSVRVEGKHASMWRFIQHRMPGETPHWTTVSRGPLTDIVDAHGEFTKTLRKIQWDITEEEWKEHLHDESPHFDVLPFSALVPEDNREDYIRAGGKLFS